MPKIVAPLTDRRIKNAKTKEKPYKLSDGGGLFVEVRATGKKTFRYKNKNKTLTIGDYPIVTLSEAREWVRSVKKESAIGVSFLGKSFKLVCDEFFEKKKGELSSKHLQGQKRRVEIYLYPLLMAKEMNKITKGDIVSVLKSVKTTNTRVNKPTSKDELTRRVFILLRQIVKFAYARDYVGANICDKIEIDEFVNKKEQTHLKAITDAEEFKNVVFMIWYIENIHKNTLNAFKFLILTSLRSGNVRGLMWEWVDLRKKIVTFPKDSMKTKKEFRVPITDTTEKILLDMGVKEKGLVFHSPREPNRMISDMAFNMILRRLGIDNHTTHGFRSSFSTICYKLQHEHGYSSDIIETQLSHSIGSKVARAYQRSDFLEERRKLLEWWERLAAIKV